MTTIFIVVVVQAVVVLHRTCVQSTQLQAFLSLCSFHAALGVALAFV